MSRRMKTLGEWLRAGWVSAEHDSRVLRLDERSKTPVNEAPFVRKLPDTFRNRKVVHESGHALVAWLCTHTVVIELDIEATAGNGKVAYAVKHEPKMTSDLAWARVVIGLAGIAGELKMLRNFRSGHAARDLAMAREDAADVKLIPTVPGDHVTFFDQKIFEVPLDDFERRLLNAALTLSKRLLVMHDDLYMKLVARCMDQDKLSEQEIEATLGSREPVLFLGELGLLTFWTKKERHG